MSAVSRRVEAGGAAVDAGPTRSEASPYEGRLALLLAGIARGDVSVEEGLDSLKQLPFADLGFARVDHHRWLRQRQLEYVYAPGKTGTQVEAIVRNLLDEGETSVVITRLTSDGAAPLLALAEERRIAFE